MVSFNEVFSSEVLPLVGEDLLLVVEDLLAGEGLLFVEHHRLSSVLCQ